MPTIVVQAGDEAACQSHLLQRSNSRWFKWLIGFGHFGNSNHLILMDNILTGISLLKNADPKHSPVGLSLVLALSISSSHMRSASFIGTGWIERVVGGGRRKCQNIIPREIYLNNIIRLRSNLLA